MHGILERFSHRAHIQTTTSRVEMEKYGLEMTLDCCLESQIQVQTVVTYRSPFIKKAMQSCHGIAHQFDAWHYATNVGSKLRAVPVRTARDSSVTMECMTTVYS